MPPLESVALLDLVEPLHWQRLQDHFTRVLGLPIRTVSLSKTLLVNPSWPAELDSERTVRLLHVGEELELLIPSAQPPHEIESLTTPLGITYASVPIRVMSEQTIACVVVGPMMVGPREDELEFHQRVNAMGVDAQTLWPLMLSLKLYTFAGIRAALHLMEEVGGSVVQLAYQAKQITTLAPMTSKVDHAVAAYQTDRIMQSLLEAATLATKAEGGSIMLYDAPHEWLRIVASQGLSDTVVATTRVKSQEGIAGWAIASRAVLLLDEHTVDEELRPWMRRKELVSSLVAPLTPGPTHEPIGVLSLRTANPQKRFTQEHVELLRRLLDLADASLTHLTAPMIAGVSGSAQVAV